MTISPEVATGSTMFILTLSFSLDSPELSQEEIERQIEEFEREILGPECATPGRKMSEDAF